MMGGPEPLTMGLMSGYGQLNYIYLYDGHGNVGQLLDLTPTTWNASTVMVARYEYDPYGRVLNQLGTFANPDTNGNPFQFSTKYYDHEVGLNYFGYRYYSSRLGRWINCDPVEELGGISFHQPAVGAPVSYVDPFGQRRFSFAFSLPQSPTGFSGYGRPEVSDDGGCVDASVVLAVERQPPGLRSRRPWKPLGLLGVHFAYGARGGIRLTAQVCCGCMFDAKACGRVEVFGRAECRHQSGHEWGGRNGFTRLRFGAGADGGVDVCCSLCSGAIAVSGQTSWYACAHFGFTRFGRTCDCGGGCEFLNHRIGTFSRAPLNGICCR